MKIRLFLFASLAFLLAACNMTLAADVTPPPNYIPPTPIPTLGALYPSQPMDIANGARIYAEKCAACHGPRGLGDGEQGKQLPVKVAALGLDEVANKAKPADWYTQVTRGNIERFMPPFASLTDQERWDVVGYAFTLHTKEDQIAKGKELFQANCADCEKYFTNLETMSALSADGLMAIAQKGMNEIPAFGANLSAEELSAVAVYLRSLTFSAAVAQVEPTAQPEATATVESAPTAETTPADESTPQAETTPAAESTIPAEPVAGTGNVSGSIENKTGADIPADAKVILRGYEHTGDMSAGPTEIVNIEGALNPDGSYLFEGVEIIENRIFIADVDVNGFSYQSAVTIVEPGMTELTIAPVVIYPFTDDFSDMKVTSLQIFFDFGTQGQAQMFAVYTIMNDTDKIIKIPMSEGSDIPFIAFPAGMNKGGYEATQDSAPFMSVDGGFAMQPSETPYGIVAFASMLKEKENSISQPLLLSVDEVMVLVPEGIEIEGSQLTDEGVQSMQGMNLRIYKGGSIAKGESLDFTLSGDVNLAAVDEEIPGNQNLLIGVGAAGVLLIGLGAWLFIRDRKKNDEEDEDEDGEHEDEDEDDTEEMMDAIIALDDLHRSGKLSDEAYKQRRDELKAKLKK